MSPLFRDLHPTCARCRGVKCTADVTCDICKDWSVTQWEAFLKRRPYSGRCKKRPSGSALPPASRPLCPPPRLLRKPDALLFPLSHSPSFWGACLLGGSGGCPSSGFSRGLPPSPPLLFGGRRGGGRCEGSGFCRLGQFGCFFPPGGGSSRIIALSGVPCAR